MDRLVATVKKYYWVLLLVFAAAGIALDLFITRRGPGISGDGVWYVEGARNLFRNGYAIQRADGFIPITIFPPFFSMVLSVLGIFAGGLVNIARFVNAFLFGGNIFLTGWVVFRLTRSPVLSVVASGMVLFYRNLLEVHVWVMTEPLFIFLMLACLANILLYLENGKFLHLALAGLSAGFSVITRYAGIAFVAGCCLTVLFLEGGRWRSRLVRATVAGLIGILPTLGWFLRNSLLHVSAAGRNGLAFHMIPRETLLSFFNTLWLWFYPAADGLGKIYRLLILLALFFLLVVVPLYDSFLRPGKVDRNHPKYAAFLGALAAIIAAYVAVVLLSILFSLAGNPFDSDKTQITRYLIPAFVMVAIWVVLALDHWSQRLEDHRLLQILPAILALGWLGLYLSQFDVFKSPFHLGYTDVINNRPDLVAALKAIDPDRAIVTNDYEQFDYLAGRPVYSIPGETDELTGKVNPQQPQLMQKIEAVIDQGAVVVVIRATPTTTLFFDPLLSTLTKIQDFGNVVFYSKSP